MSTIFKDGTRVNGTNRDEALYKASQLPFRKRNTVKANHKPKPNNHARNVAARIHNNEARRNDPSRTIQ